MARAEPQSRWNRLVRVGQGGGSGGRSGHNDGGHNDGGHNDGGHNDGGHDGGRGTGSPREEER